MLELELISSNNQDIKAFELLFDNVMGKLPKGNAEKRDHDHDDVVMKELKKGRSFSQGSQGDETLEPKKKKGAKKSTQSNFKF